MSSQTYLFAPWPTPADITRAVTAASLEFDLDPMMVGSQGVKLRHTARARTYAALALREVFSAVGKTRASTMVGGQRNTLTKFYTDRAAGGASWFLPETLRRVTAAVRRGAKDPDQLSLALGPSPKAEARPPVILETLEQARSFLEDRPVAVPKPRRHTENLVAFPALAIKPRPLNLPPLKAPVCITRHEPVRDNFGNATEEFFADPPPDRSALAEAKPWVPYEERVKKTRAWRSLTCSQPSRYEHE